MRSDADDPFLAESRSQVVAGDKLTEGQVNPKELLEVAGVMEVQNYILKEVKKVYASQGIEISDKHIEVMIRQMLRKIIVIDGGDTGLSAGQTLSLNNITGINRACLLAGRASGGLRSDAAGYLKSICRNRFLPVRGILPGNHQGPDRSGDQGQGRPSDRSEGKRYHRQADPSGNRLKIRA